MTRKIKQLILQYLKSKIIRSIIVFFAKVYNHLIRVVRIFSFGGWFVGPPAIWNKSTKQWCKRYNIHHTPKAEYHKLYDTHRTHVHKAPQTIVHDKPHPEVTRYTQEPQYEQFVANIPGGKIVGTYTNVSPDYKILRDGSRYRDSDLYGNPYTYQLYLWAFHKKDQTIALLSSNDSFKNYRHWILYALPKFHLFQKSGIAIDAYATDYHSKYNRESLELLGISKEKIIILDETSRIEAKNLLVASTPTLLGNVPQRTIDFLQSTFVSESILKQPNAKRIFISRVTNRKIINEKELLAYLEPLGFERVVLDQMSVKEQADLFNRAEVVIGPHGAGLINTIFCRPGTTVIELQHEDTIKWHIYALCNACQLEYAYIVGNVQKDPSKIEMDQDMHIPLVYIKDTLKLMNIH